MTKAWFLALSASLALGLCSLSNAHADQTFMGATDLPGQDIATIPIDPPSIAAASICRGFCVKNSACNSWTLVASGVQGPKAMCWLKQGVPNAVANRNCESGVVGRREEPGIDRPGLDYKRNIITGPPRECRETCEGDANCAAWTYTGTPGKAPLCFLKSSIPDAVSNGCCTSGVVTER